jgi:outer membrane protein OmpA-like peptidoglycan-associated protein
MKSIIILSSFLYFFSISVGAQERQLDKANQKYQQLAFIDASEVYLEVAQSGYKSEELFKKLGNSYYFNANYAEAFKWYRELFQFINAVSEPIYYLRYSQSLKAVGHDKESQQWFDRYAQQAGLSNKKYKTAEDYLALIEQNSGRYQIKSLPINTEGVDFGSSFLGDRMVFASTKDTLSIHKRKSAWDGLSFLDLYEVTHKDDSIFSEPTPLKGEVNTKLHESSAVFTRDGKTMYFTRNNMTPYTKRAKDEVQHLKIYRAYLVNELWSQIEDLSINGDLYSTAHPALSPDEKFLYFASDRPESLGLTDLFKVPIDADGTLGAIVNLGDKVNTKGRESFPFLSKDNELYFSSDGHYGLGGYDVFYGKIEEDGTIENLLNVGKPINSPYDDVAFIIDNHKGYISSNREGGKGYDDIYRFIETEDIKELLKSRIFGVVTDKNTLEPIALATITLFDENNNELIQLQTDENGFYESEVDYYASYLLKTTKEGYTSADDFSEKEIKEREHNFQLEKLAPAVKKGDDIAKLLNIIIHFDLDKSFIRADAQVELEKLVVYMKKYPSVSVDIRSHTDSRANDAYNIALSNRRAKSTLSYLVQRGIPREKLTARGYGETQLVNDCTNGVKCTDDEHQANRRSEFIITNN